MAGRWRCASPRATSTRRRNGNGSFTITVVARPSGSGQSASLRDALGRPPGVALEAPRATTDPLSANAVLGWLRACRGPRSNLGRFAKMHGINLSAEGGPRVATNP